MPTIKKSPKKKRGKSDPLKAFFGITPAMELKGLRRRVTYLEKECSRLRHEMTQETVISQQDSTEPPAKEIAGDEFIRIYIVWTIGLYANGVRMLDIRAVTTSLRKAKLYSQMLRRDKEPHEFWDRIAIEPRVANHLYGQELREKHINTGQQWPRPSERP